MKVYQELDETWKDGLLEEYWKDDFETVNIDMFRDLPKDVRRKWRDHLRTQGVYVPLGKGIKIPDALHKALKEELSWPKNEKKPDATTRNSTKAPSSNYSMIAMMKAYHDVSQEKFEITLIRNSKTYTKFAHK